MIEKEEERKSICVFFKTQKKAIVNQKNVVLMKNSHRAV